MPAAISPLFIFESFSVMLWAATEPPFEMVYVILIISPGFAFRLSTVRDTETNQTLGSDITAETVSDLATPSSVQLTVMVMGLPSMSSETYIVCE